MTTSRRMGIATTIGTAVEALRRNALRSGLTALGIIIGVGAVIVMMAIGDGARQSIEARIRTAGANIVMVSPGSATVGGARLGQGAVTTLVADVWAFDPPALVEPWYTRQVYKQLTNDDKSLRIRYWNCGENQNNAVEKTEAGTSDFSNFTFTERDDE